MSVTPETLVRHELIGLAVRVEDATQPELLGLAGRVVDETQQTLVVRPPVSGQGRLGDATERARRIPKAGTTFVFTLEDGTNVLVDGERLVERPARRTEQRGVSAWV